MTRPSDCSLCGKVNKTHGLDGELSISFYSERLMESIQPGACLVFEIDGIFTPFFVRAVRPRGAEAFLVALDNVDSQEAAQEFVGKSVYSNLDTGASDDADPEGMYAGQLEGYTAVNADDGMAIGKIVDIDDATDNVLFVILKPDGKECRIPVVEDFIQSISKRDRRIYFTLPAGLLNL